jgi:hypothetical protein
MGVPESRVDGNALAGLLHEVFVHEMTSARIKCEGCSAIEPIGAQHVYMNAPGIVVRCCRCEGVLLTITQRDGSCMIGFHHIVWLDIQKLPE